MKHRECDIYIHLYTQAELEEISIQRENQKRINRCYLRACFQETSGQAFDENNVKKGVHGKPYMEDSLWQYNISHSKGCLVIGLCQEEIGVDVEEMRKIRTRTLLRSCNEKEKIRFGLNEQQMQSTFVEQPEVARQFLSLWTLKESFIKMTGDGLSYPIRQLDFQLEEEEKYHQKLLQVKANRTTERSYHGIFQVKPQEQEKEIFLSVTLPVLENDYTFKIRII